MGIAGGNRVVTFARVVCPVGRHRPDVLFGRDLVGQFWQHRCVANIACRDLNRPDLQRFFIDPYVYLAPNSAFLAAMLASVPFAFAPLHASVRIAKPAELGLSRWGELNEKARRLVEADRLWFVLTHELVAFQASARPASGPRSASKVQREKAAQRILNQLHARHPDARMVREDASIALKKLKFSLKAAGRIWDNAAPESWKISGKPAYEMKRLSSDDLLEALQQAGV